MSVLVELTDDFADVGGPLANVLVTAELEVPRRAGMSAVSSMAGKRFSARTNAEGELSLELWPNTEGYANTWYVFNAWHPTTGNKIIDNATGVVPGYSVTLTDVLSRNPNPAARAVARAESTLTRNDYLVAMGKVADMGTGYSKRSYQARLDVVNMKIWPYSNLKLEAASSAVALLNDGALKTSLQAEIAVFDAFVAAYTLAAKAAHSHSAADKTQAQSALNAAPYDDQFSQPREFIQSLIDSTVMHARFDPDPLLSELNDMSELVANAHPFMSADGLAVRNPGQNTFLFVGDTEIEPGSGWHCVEFELLADCLLDSRVGVADAAQLQAVLDGNYNDSQFSLQSVPG